MPRKKRTIVEETIPDAAPESTDDLSDVVCILSKVYKINGGGKSFCFQTTEPVDEVYIQAQYPTGGKFVVNEYNSLNQIIRTEHIEIEPKPMTNGNGNGSGGDLHTRLLLDELAFTRNMMLKMIEGIAGNKEPKEHTPLGELAQAMQVVNEMSGKSNPTDLILKGMELGMKANGGEPDWKSQLIDTAKTVIPAFAGQRTAAPAQQQITTGQEPMIKEQMMKQGLAWLKPQIISGMTVDLAVGWVIQNAKDPMCNQLMVNAISGDVNTFIAIDPEIANEPYRTWFESAIQLLKDEYNAQHSNDVHDNDGRNGNDTDVEVNANAGTGKPKVTKVS